MKALKTIKRILWEIFDFFCGDWWHLLGAAVTVLILYAIDKVGFLSFLRPVNFILYPILFGLTLMYALNKAAKK